MKSDFYIMVDIYIYIYWLCTITSLWYFVLIRIMSIESLIPLFDFMASLVIVFEIFFSKKNKI